MSIFDGVNDHYIGDGIYAQFDGPNLWLKVDISNGSIYVFPFDLQALEALNEYVKQHKPND